MTTTLDTADLKLVRIRDGLEIDLDVLQGAWTVDQYLKITNDTNRLIEFTDGYIEVLPMPTRKHQVISRFLFLALLTFVQRLGGTVLYAPLRLQLATGRFREPDLLLLLDKRDPRNQDAFWLGADLVVEIVSPDNPDRDLIDKRRDYAQAGIPEYWIVNPLTDTITVLTREGDTYAEHGVFVRGTPATSVLLPSFTVDVAAVFDAE
jgi:Uma2 family endonuclease